MLVKEVRYPYQYRCKVTADNGPEYSEVVCVIKPAVLTVSVDPVTVEAEIGETVVFTATAENAKGTVGYQWEYRTTEEGEWKNCTFTGNKTASLSVLVKEVRYPYQYRCKVTDENGSAYSDIVSISRLPYFTIEDVKYLILEDRVSLRIVSYEGNSSTVIIPQAPKEGYIVTEVGADAFAGNTSLTSITLPNTITVIGARAFKGCTNLSSMNTH